VSDLQSFYRRRRWTWSTFGLSVASLVLAIGVLLLVVGRQDGRRPKATECPSAAVVTRALGTRVGAPSAVSEDDLLGCFYQQGTNQQAVSVSFATPTLLAAGPCQRRPTILVSGARACDLAGTAGTSASLAVDAGHDEDQFSTDLPQVSFGRLEALAVKVLAARPPDLRSSDTD
jgi:hypothetical protein